ncbi:hypothetical protein [Nocardioides piscis]|uniref:Uncharacterized protein n=1 Tax=Nocardioides piscis TaxID=2714938 RepID=A0A6G7YH74_9ACTN|nr:hypothetical protein [Nocardioides piscis]QIK75967.1 hypothetical protein G7071_11475 [Nocardioides piscis]
MRGKIAVVTALTAGVVSVGSLSLGGQSVAIPATSEEQVAGTPVPSLPEEVEGGVIVDLADGDRFTVTTSRDMRTVWGSRYDAATRSWSARRVIVREKNLYCGRVDARGAGNAVAVIAECDTGGYSEDTAPTSSRALYSPDTVSWHASTLPGEAHEEPGISPSGSRAVWPLHQGWVSWTGTGFDVERRELPGQEYTVTGTVSDSGDVSILYGGARDASGECVLGVTTVAAGTGTETRQQLPADYACSDVNLANVDALTVLFGEFSSPQTLLSITRPDTASPWTTTGVTPEDAPGLARHRGRRSAATTFVSSPGLPLLAVGSADRRTFTAQTYDWAAQRWSEPLRVDRSDARCSWSRSSLRWAELGLVALGLDCGRQQRLLVTTDALTWHDIRLGRPPVGVSPDSEQVSVSNRRRTLVFSREDGLVRLPVGAPRRCDVVQPVSPRAAVRLTTKHTGGWPSALQKSTASGWRPTKAPVARPRAGGDRCRTVEPQLHDEPASYVLRGRRSAFVVTLTARGAGWRVRSQPY